MESDKLLVLASILFEEEHNDMENIRYTARLDQEARRRRYMRIPRISLQDPEYSAFSVLYSSGSDQSLITVTGFDHKSFRVLLDLFVPYYNRYTPYTTDGYIRRIRNTKKGRPRSMKPEKALGLALAWFRTRGSEMGLCLLFGITASVCSLFTRFCHRILLKILSEHELACVKMPTSELFFEFNSCILEEYPLLSHVYCFMDGLKLSLESAGQSNVQNVFYNGWQHGHFVNCVFVFAPNGTIIAGAVNAPGSLHDSTIADWGGIYEKLGKFYELHQGKCVADSAFSSSSHDFLIKSAPNHDQKTRDLTEFHLRTQATKLRQASEWGMRAFQGSFPRLKDKFKYEERGERRVILELTTFLFNMRARVVGQNQIATTFMPHLLKDANSFFAPSLV